jgi:hypothetical protein
VLVAVVAVVALLVWVVLAEVAMAHSWARVTLVQQILAVVVVVRVALFRVVLVVRVWLLSDTRY